MQILKFDYSKANTFVKEHEIAYLDSFIKCAHDMLHDKKGPGSDFLGWVDLPVNYDGKEFIRIKA
ncbi:MAG: glucose-6-phosphate isomerase, partial [Ruminiclostridium sp.]|nr:glucose-6-phosphate isomerase [Ruminiclostridium sp.]